MRVSAGSTNEMGTFSRPPTPVEAGETRPEYPTPPLIELAEISIDQREPSQEAAGPPISGGIRFTKSAIRPSMSATRFLRLQFCSCFSRP